MKKLQHFSPRQCCYKIDLSLSETSQLIVKDRPKVRGWVEIDEEVEIALKCCVKM